MMRKGMTLIELLIVLLIVGILASIMGLRMRDASGAAMLATVRADLRTFAVAEYVFHTRNDRFGGDGDSFEFASSPGVELTINWASKAGYAATALHVRRPATLCGVFVGPAPDGSFGPAKEQGVVACD